MQPSLCCCNFPAYCLGALAEDPKLLLLDELTTFLDVEDQFGVLQAVKSITRQRRDVTAVWVTHRYALTLPVSMCCLMLATLACLCQLGSAHMSGVNIHGWNIGWNIGCVLLLQQGPPCALK